MNKDLYMEVYENSFPWHFQLPLCNDSFHSAVDTSLNNPQSSYKLATNHVTADTIICLLSSTDAISYIPKRNPSSGGATTYALDHKATGMGCVHVLHLERLLHRNCGIWTEGNCLFVWRYCTETHGLIVCIYVYMCVCMYARTCVCM